MWNTILTKTSELLLGTLDLLSQTVGVLLIAAAIGLYFYTLIDRRVPRFVIPPVLCILVAAGVMIITHIHTRDAERFACDVKAQEQQRKLDDLTMQAAIDIRKVEDQAAQDRLKLAHYQKQQSLDLQAALDEEKRLDAEQAAREALATAALENANKPQLPTVDFKPILPENQSGNTNVPASNPKPVVRTACLTERVPSSIVRALNGSTGAASNTKGRAVSNR